MGPQIPDLAFRRGETLIEVENAGPQPTAASREKKPGQKIVSATKPAPLGVETTASSSAPQLETTNVESAGITDGSELGIRPPEYPALSRLRGEQGTVLILLKMDTNQRLHSVEILQSSGYPALDRSAVLAIKAALKSVENSLPLFDKKLRFHFKLIGDTP